MCFAFLWVPACAGMTGGWRGNDGGFTLTLALSRRGRGDVPGPAPLGVPACAGMTGGWHGNDGACSPSPSDPLLISPWEGEGDGSRERGFNCGAKDGSGVLCFSLGSPACAGMTGGMTGGWPE